MAAKFVVFTLLAATAHASGGYSSFSYGVSDPNTGDIKDQHENRVGGNVVGKYSLLESDGTKRVVEYTASDATGFKAVVRKEPAGALGAAAVGAPLAHAGAIAAAAPLANGALPATTTHAGAAHAVHIAHTAPMAAAAPLATATPLAHISYLGASSPLAHTGALTNHLAYANAAHLGGYAGTFAPGSQYGGYNNLLASSLGYAGHASNAPTVSSYSHTIVHNGPDAFPYGGANSRYGAYGGYGGAYRAAVTPGGSFAHGNPWAAGETLGAHGGSWPRGASFASPLAAGGHGALGLGYGSKLSW